MHAVNPDSDGETLLYIDRHFLHEVTSPQAFEGIEKKGINPWRLDSNVATPDHNVSTQRGKMMDICLLYTSPSPRDLSTSRMPSSA